MRRIRTRLLMTVLTGALAFSARAQDQEAAITLKVGDRAPALTPGEWIKGEPVAGFASGTVYVVEFWATWCGPCRMSIPHLSDLQARFKDKGLVVIGQNCSERNPAKVRPFVQEMGDKMNYRVALDDTNSNTRGRMATAWMEASGQQGIPAAFVVDQQGRIAWIGHPMDGLDPVLEKVLAGTFDAKAVAEQSARVREAQQSLSESLQAGDFDTALTRLDALAAIDPANKPRLLPLKFQILLEKKDYTAAYALGNQVIDLLADSAEDLNAFAWTLATAEGLEKRDLELAGKAAARASELTQGKDAPILDTVARIHFEKGEIDKAIAVATAALAIAGEDDKEPIAAALAKYKAAAKP